MATLFEVKDISKKIHEELEKYKDEDGNIPFKYQFIGTIEDFNLLRRVDLEDTTEISDAALEHLENSLDSFLHGTFKKNKTNFSLNTVIGIQNLLNGKIENIDELLQALYMTIFQRYNDDIKINENYNVTPEFARTVYRINGEKMDDTISSEKDLGNIYMTEETYNEFLDIYKNAEPDNKIETLRLAIVNYCLRNIRNRMMHGGFYNKVDSNGNKIVELEPFGFKAKFFFKCILEFYEVIAKEIKNKVRKEDVLFDLEKVLLEGSEESGKSLLEDKDELLKALIPIYVNSCLTYNFSDVKRGIEKLGKESISSDTKEFFDRFYKRKDSNSFIAKVVAHNCNYSEYEIINHFRNSVVHNNFLCKNGIAFFDDYDENGLKTASFEMPYSLFEELIENQGQLAKKSLSQRVAEASNFGGR